jgi:hypothetical protein
MVDYVDNMIKEFPEELSPSEHPWNENLFRVESSSKLLPKEKNELFHTFVAETLFSCKHARPDIQPAIAFLTTRVKSLDEQDWTKLVKMMCCLNHMHKDVMVLSADDSQGIIWHVDAAFAVHNFKKSHTGAIILLGGGAIFLSL